MAPDHIQDDPFKAALLRLRKAIGIIGLMLPIILIAGALTPPVEMQTSISHFFYTPMRELFVIALSVIGIFLITYHGYDPAPGDWLSDYWVSTTAGSAVLIVATVPTLCDMACGYGPLSLFDGWVSNETLQDWLHFGSAGIFLGALAVMCLCLFTKSNKTCPSQKKLRRNRLYRICGVVIVATILTLALFKIPLVAVGDAWDKSWYFTFWAEAIAVWAFGIAWLVKGQALDETIIGAMLYDTPKPSMDP